jgi:hypothetical protein
MSYFQPDNSPEAREVRKQAYAGWEMNEEDENVLRVVQGHAFAEPKVVERDFQLIVGGVASAGVHDDSFDHLKCGTDNVMPLFPTEPEDIVA